MRYLLILLLILGVAKKIDAQKIYTITADSTKLTGCDSNELIIENHTQAVKGFLYNTGNGRTIFKKGLIRLSDSLYLIGADTLRSTPNGWIQGGNRWGTTGILGTLDNNHLDLYTAGTYKARLATNGNFILGTTRDTMSARLQVAGTSFFSDVVQVANGKQLNVGSIYIIDDPNGRNITSIANEPVFYTGGKGGYALMDRVVKLASDTSIIFSPGNAINNAIIINSVVPSPSSTTFSFGNLRNDGPQKAVINTTDFDATAQGGTTAIDLQLYPGKEIHSGSQGNTIIAHDGANERGNVMIGTSTPTAGYRLMVNGGIFQDGGPFYKKYYTDRLQANLKIGSGYELYGIPHSAGGYTLYFSGGLDGTFGSAWDLAFGTPDHRIMTMNNNAVITNQPFYPAAGLVFQNQYSYQSSPYTGFKYANERGWDWAIVDSANTPKLVVTWNGNVLVGTTTNNGPKLNVGGSGAFAGALSVTGGVQFAGLSNDDTKTNVLVSDGSGNLYYRTAASLADLDIIHSSLAVAMPKDQKWPDYVFDSTYRLPDLKSETEYAIHHGHLPGIASAEDVATHGIDLARHATATLKKIEELTLYVARQDKKLSEQNEEIKALRKEMEEMKKLLRKSLL